MKLKCLQCDHEFDGTISKNDLGWHSVCPECGGSFDVDVPEGRIVVAFTDKVDGDDPYRYFTDNFIGENIWEYFAYDTVEEFIKAWLEYCEEPYGMWYWVLDEGRCVTNGACSPDGDIEIFRDWFGEEMPDVEEDGVSSATSEQEECSAITKLAYKRFQLFWMLDHGFGVDDLLKFAQNWAEVNRAEDNTPQDYPITEALEDSGLDFGFSLWPCFGEFLDAEYQDAQFIKRILDKKEYAKYLEDIGRLRICRVSDPLDESKPCIERWNTVDGTLYRPGDFEEIQPSELPKRLQWLYTCGFCGDNMYLCSYGDRYGVAVVYEYHKSETQKRGLSMEELFSCAVADAVQMASCDEAEGPATIQIIATERSGALLGNHEVCAFIPAVYPEEQIRRAIQAFDSYAFKASYSDGHLFIGNASANTERLFVPTPVGAISAYRVGGNEYPGVAVDFFPNGAEDCPSVVVEYTGSTVKARFHKKSNSEPIIRFNMGTNI